MLRGLSKQNPRKWIDLILSRITVTQNVAYGDLASGSICQVESSGKNNSKVILGQVQLIIGLFIENKKSYIPSSQKLHYLQGKNVVTHLPCKSMLLYVY